MLELVLFGILFSATIFTIAAWTIYCITHCVAKHAKEATEKQCSTFLQAVDKLADAVGKISIETHVETVGTPIQEQRNSSENTQGQSADKSAGQSVEKGVKAEDFTNLVSGVSRPAVSFGQEE